PQGRGMLKNTDIATSNVDGVYAPLAGAQCTSSWEKFGVAADLYLNHTRCCRCLRHNREMLCRLPLWASQPSDVPGGATGRLRPSFSAVSKSLVSSDSNWSRARPSTKSFNRLIVTYQLFPGC